MCNLLHFSTTSGEDFSALPRDNYIIERPREEEAGLVALLVHPQKWYIACRYGGCSCHFRHIIPFYEKDGAFFPVENGFARPEEDEFDDSDEQVIEDTGALYDLFSRLVAQGHGVDVLDSWNGEDLEHVRAMEVSLSEVGRDRFRFFESCRFEMRA